MTGDIDIRRAGRAGRITLTRPAALNALTHDMCLAVEAELDAWRTDNAVSLVVIDAAGDKAFCAGGDIAEMYARGRRGDFGYGRRFWRDEYRMNAKLFAYPKPIVSFLQGFTMGGGVGLGCHGSHRIVGDSSRVGMPECGIGLIPDVGGSLILARAPGRIGEYLGVTGTRMAAADAIFAGFGDHYRPESAWPDLIAALEETGDAALIDNHPPPAAPLADRQREVDALFSAATLDDLHAALAAHDGPFAQTAAKALSGASPLSAACTLAVIRQVRTFDTIGAALDMEYRFTSRAMEHGDFLEGIRAAIIDKDRQPAWRAPTLDDIAAMLRPVTGTPLDLGGSS